MIGIDTNVLVRFLVRDDAAQFEAARKLLTAEQPVLISLIVMLETEWVLRSRYRRSKTEIATAFSYLLETREMLFEDEQTLEEALYAWKNGSADFADCLIVAKARRLGCRSVFTFDTKAARLPGAVLLEVQ